MAVWGAPVAHEDDAERGVRAALELVEAVRGLGPGMQARAGVLTGEAAVTLGATDQGMVAGDLVNTASRLQSAAAPGTVLVGEATQRAASGAIAFEPAGEQVLKGKEPPVDGLAGAPRRRRARRSRAQRPARGAVRRARRGAAPAQGPVPRDLPRAARPPRLDHRPGRHRQEPARLGVPEVRRRRRRRRLVARRPVARLRRGRHVLGARRDGPRRAPASPRPTTRRRRGRKVAEMLATLRPGRGASARWIEPALLALLGRRRRAGRRPRRAVPRLAHVLRAAGRDRHRRAWCSRTSTGRTPGLLDFIDHLLEWSRGVPILIITLARPELLSAGPTGAPAGATSWPSALEPLTERRCASCWPVSSPACRRRRRARSSPAPTASPCTRSRRSGCSSPTGGCARPTAATSRSATSASWPSPRRSRRSSRRASTASIRPTGRSSRTRPSSARASRWTGLAAVTGERADPRSSRGCATWPRPSCSPRRSTRGRPSGAVRVRPGAHPRGRLRHARQARPALAPPGRRPVLRIARRGRAGRRARGPLHRRVARRCRRVPRATPSPSRRGSRSSGRADRAVALGSPEQRRRLPPAGAPVTADPAERAPILERAGRAAARCPARTLPGVPARGDRHPARDRATRPPCTVAPPRSPRRYQWPPARGRGVLSSQPSWKRRASRTIASSSAHLSASAACGSARTGSAEGLDLVERALPSRSARS